MPIEKEPAKRKTKIFFKKKIVHNQKHLKMKQEKIDLRNSCFLRWIIFRSM